MRALKITGILLLVLILVPVIAVSFFGAPIARAVVKSLNNRLQTEIVVADYDVSFWANFPSLSVDLSDVQVAGSDGSDLLMAEQLSCLLDLGSLFGKIRVEEIVVSDGSLNLIVDVDGNTNYQLTGYTPIGEEKPEDPNAEATEFAIADARFKGMEISYRDAQLQVYLNGNIDRLSFSGDFGADEYLLATEGLLDIYHLDQDGIRYLNETQMSLDAQTSAEISENGRPPPVLQRSRWQPTHERRSQRPEPPRPLRVPRRANRRGTVVRHRGADRLVPGGALRHAPERGRPR